MKLTAKADLEAPIGFVFASVSDFTAWEREAIRKGAEIERPVDAPLSGKGAIWRVRGMFRGKQRKLVIRLEGVEPDQALRFNFDSPSATGTSAIELTPLSPRRTRIRLVLDVQPKTLAARLFINTLRLARRRVQARYDKRAEQLAARVEQLYKRSRVAAPGV